jgi:hypothetical protein
MAVKYFKWPYKIPPVLIPRPSKVYPNRVFWYENICTIWQHWIGVPQLFKGSCN